MSNSSKMNSTSKNVKIWEEIISYNLGLRKCKIIQTVQKTKLRLQEFKELAQYHITIYVKLDFWQLESFLKSI